MRNGGIDLPNGCGLFYIREEQQGGDTAQCRQGTLPMLTSDLYRNHYWP